MTEYKATTMNRISGSSGREIRMEAANMAEVVARLRAWDLLPVQVWYRNQGQWFAVPSETVRQYLPSQ